MAKEYNGDAKELETYLPGFTYLSAWSSPEKFVRYVKTLRRKDAWQDAGWDKGNPEWYGSETMEEAIALAESGWKEGVDQLEKTRNRVLSANPLLPKPIKYGIAGVTPNVPRAVSGNILNMRQPDMDKSKRRPVLTLICNMSANCGVSSSAITNRAAVVAAIVDQIEVAGFSCEVITTATSRGGGFAGSSGFSAAISVVLKRSDQAVDLSKLAYGLGHASFFRRLIFADKGSAKICKDGLGSGLGYPYNISPSEARGGR